MTQITKTLSIAGIIVLATAPAMAEIASTAYVQSIVNNIDIPTYTAGNGISITNNAISVAGNVLTNGASTGTGNISIDGWVEQDGNNNFVIKGSVGDYDNTGISGSTVIDGYTNANDSIAIGGSIEYSSTNSIAIGGSVGDNSRDSVAIVGSVNPSSRNAVAIGKEANTRANDTVAIGYKAIAESDEAVAIGGGAYAEMSAIAIGGDASARTSAIAIGGSASMDAIAIGGSASMDGIAIGGNVNTTFGYDGAVPQSIQLGYGTNSVNGTFSVGLDDANGHSGNYTLLDASGKIPAERLSGGILTNAATGSTLLAIGNNVRQSGINNGGIVIGDGAALWGGDGESDSPGDDSIAIGTGAEAGSSQGVAIAIGPNASATAWDRQFSMAIGYGATAGENAIQLGTGNNSNENTFQVFGTTLLNDDGIVPATALAPEISSNCKASVGQKCALVVTWDGSEYSQSWEVVRSTSSGQ